MEDLKQSEMFNDANWIRLSFPDKINKFMDWFPKITKEESDFISQILSWDDETRMSFSFAKRIFEEKDD